MLSEIGSNFWIDSKDDLSGEGNILLSDLGLVGTDYVLLSTGRGAENFVLKEIYKRNKKLTKTALIPPYTCETVITPFIQNDYKLHTYNVDENLQTTPEMLERALEDSNASVVLLHNYFGFNTLSGCENVIRRYSQKGVVFIEDRTQNLFSDFDVLPADYFVGSLRKWAALPDGGYAVCKDGSFDSKPNCYDQKLTNAKVNASIAKYQYLFNGIGEKADFLEMYNEAENILDEQKGFYAISPVSKTVFKNMDIVALKEKRRQNYQMLYDVLEKCSNIKIVMGKLTEETVPLYFVIKTKYRNELQRHLRNHQIYAPVLWPRSYEEIAVCKEAKLLYEQVLCIPIDQRYDSDDMKRIAQCVKKAYIASVRI